MFVHIWLPIVATRLDDRQLDELIKTWNICCHRLLGLPPNTRTYVIPHIMDIMPIKYIVMSRILNFFISGLKHENETISMFFKNVLTSHTSYMLQNVNTILNEFDIRYNDIFEMNKTMIRCIIRSKSGDPDWRGSMIMDLLSLRENQSSCNLSPAEVASLLTYVSTAR